VKDVLVDRRGILIIEVKTWNEGFLRGTADERYWTVVYGGSQKHRHHNPLLQLGSQRDALRKALRAAGEPLDPDALQSIVVFVGGTITDKLELTTEERAKITTIYRLPDVLRARQASLADAGGWDASTIMRRYQQIQALNRSSDPAAQAAHERYRKRFRDRAPGELSVPSAARSLPTPARPVAQRPPVPYQARRVTRSTPSAGIAVVLTLLVAVMFACVVPSLLKVALDDFAKGIASHTLPAATAPATPPPGVPANVETAKAVLKQVAPEVYEGAVHRDQPVTADNGDGSRTFTWEYLARSGARTALVKQFSLTLRPDGSIAGMAASH
jgi:hypothetical protein